MKLTVSLRASHHVCSYATDLFAIIPQPWNNPIQFRNSREGWIEAWSLLLIRSNGISIEA
jgi:hypothetical protein